MKIVPDMIERHDDHDRAPQQVNGRNAGFEGNVSGRHRCLRFSGQPINKDLAAQFSRSSTRN
jgi:hypothetical protein